MHRFLLKKNSGFSLVELLILLSMTAVVSAFSIPMLTSAMREMQTQADAKSIATTMTYARMSAASQLTRYRMNFDVENNRWALSKRNPDGTYTVEQATNELSKIIARSGITFKSESDSAPPDFPTESSTTITFNSRGVPMEGAGVIYLSSENVDYAISVSVAGKVQFWRNQDSQWIAK